MLDEQANLRQWRIDQLERMGFTLAQARRLAAIPDITHQAEKLLSQGCSHELAAKLLRPAA